MSMALDSFNFNMKNNKVVTKYDEQDIAEIITSMFLNVETPEGIRFKALQVSTNVVAIKVGNKNFIINISSKENLN